MLRCKSSMKHWLEAVGRFSEDLLSSRHLLRLKKCFVPFYAPSSKLHVLRSMQRRAISRVRTSLLSPACPPSISRHPPDLKHLLLLPKIFISREIVERLLTVIQGERDGWVVTRCRAESLLREEKSIAEWSRMVTPTSVRRG